MTREASTRMITLNKREALHDIAVIGFYGI